ncbi:MAG TPA: cytochrome b/b6 domain-containing protein [Nitrospira sp.]|nr:cytochrome b/b6 domain-containing protein [Nitrospira sp.]
MTSPIQTKADEQSIAACPGRDVGLGVRDHLSERPYGRCAQMVPDPIPPSEKIYRHTWPVRLGHWLNAVCLFILIGSGLQIFNAHPALYWGDRSDRDKALLSIRPMRSSGGEIRGITTVLGRQFDTTGVLGYSNGAGRAFPAWATIPSPRWLAMGRQWHLFFAWVFVLNGLIFAAYGLGSRHFKKDLLPTGLDLKDISRAVKDHLLLRHPKGEQAKRYNVLQKLAYLAVIFLLAPLIVLTGLAMSPTIDAAFPWLLSLFGGRQAARTIHFLACFSFVGFIVVHLLQVILTGLFNNLRSMITGYFAVKHEGVSHEA